MTKRSFRALFEAMSAAVQGDAKRLESILTAQRSEHIYGQAARHKCVGPLLTALVEHRIRTPQLSELLRALRKYSATFALDSLTTGAQIDDLVRAFNGERIPHALLKSAARIHVGDRTVGWSQIFDIDVLVPADRTQDAQRALVARGYRCQYDAATAEGYLAYHHHLAPLLPPGPGKPVEIHFCLAQPHHFSLRTDWHALRHHVEPIGGLAAPSARLDAFGRCLHLAIHGAGLHRLADAVAIAAELRKDPSMLSRVAAYVSSESVQRIPLLSTIAIAARIAGLEAECDRYVERYVDWIVRREDLPRGVRGRTEFVDAWFANGGRFAGPSTVLAMPPARLYDGTAVHLLRRARFVLGHAATGVAGLGYAAIMGYERA